MPEVRNGVKIEELLLKADTCSKMLEDFEQVTKKSLVPILTRYE